MNLDLLYESDTYVSLLTLTAMEVVLGIDNIVFISILTGKLPPEQQPKARRLGLSLALIMRLGLLFALTAWLTDSLDIKNFLWAMVGALVLTIVTFVLSWITGRVAKRPST